MSIIIAQSSRKMPPVTLSSGDTEIPLGFPLLAEEEVVVTRTRAGLLATLILNVDYGVGDLSTVPGSKIILSVAALENDIIEAWGVAQIVRETIFADGGKYNAEQHNLAFERSRIIEQEQTRDIGRSLKTPMNGGDYNADNKIITNLANGVAGNDAVNKTQLEAYVASGVQGPQGAGSVTKVANKTAMKLLDTATNEIAYDLSDKTSWAMWHWDAGILIAEHQVDTVEGFYAAPDPLADGAWVRSTPVHVPEDFGAVGDQVTDDRTALVLANTVSLLTGRPVLIDQKKYYVPATNPFRFTCDVINITSNQTIPDRVVTLGVADDWENIIPNLEENAIVTLEAGFYTGTKPMRFVNKRIVIKADVGATVNWAVETQFYNCPRSYISGVSFRSLNDTTLVLAFNSDLLIDDCQLATSGGTSLKQSSFLQATVNSTVAIRFLTKNCLFVALAGHGSAQLMASDYSSYIWFGGTTGFYSIVYGPTNNTPAPDNTPPVGTLLAVTGAFAYTHNVRFVGDGKTGNTTGVGVARGGNYRGLVTSDAPITCGVWTCGNGVASSRGGQSYISGDAPGGTGAYYLTSCTNGMTNNGGGKMGKDKTTVVASATTNFVVQDTATDWY